MKYIYIKYLLFFILFTILLDKSIGSGTEAIIPSQTSGVIGIVNKTIHDKSNVLILGSSRAQNHYNSTVMGKVMNQTVFNSGMGGQGLFYNYAVLKERLKLNSPKLVVLDLAPGIMLDLKQYDKLSAFYPVAKQYKTFDSIMYLNKEYKPILMYSNAYRYNSTAFQIFYDLVSPTDKGDAFVAIDGSLSKNQKAEIFEAKNVQLSKNNLEQLKIQLEYVDKIKNLCQKYNVRLVATISPLFYEDKISSESIPMIRKHLDSKNILLYNFAMHNTFYKNETLFKDAAHLNKRGSELYSEIVANKITLIINSN